MSAPTRLALAMLVVPAMLLAGCGGNQRVDTPAPSPTPQATSTVPSPTPSPSVIATDQS